MGLQRAARLLSRETRNGGAFARTLDVAENRPGPGARSDTRPVASGRTAGATGITDRQQVSSEVMLGEYPRGVIGEGRVAMLWRSASFSREQSDPG